MPSGKVFTLLKICIAGSRYSHSYSKPCYSYSRTKSRHSRCYSHYRRKARPKGKPPLSSLEIIPCSRSPHSYLTREGVTLLNLPKDIFNFLRIGKELPRVLIRVSLLNLILTKKRPVPNFVLTSSKKSITQKERLINFCWVISEQLKCLLFASGSICKKAKLPSSCLLLFPFCEKLNGGHSS